MYCLCEFGWISSICLLKRSNDRKDFPHLPTAQTTASSLSFLIIMYGSPSQRQMSSAVYPPPYETLFGLQYTGSDSINSCLPSWFVSTNSNCENSLCTSVDSDSSSSSFWNTTFLKTCFLSLFFQEYCLLFSFL